MCKHSASQISHMHNKKETYIETYIVILIPFTQRSLLCSKGYIYSQTYSIYSKVLTLFQGLHIQLDLLHSLKGPYFVPRATYIVRLIPFTQRSLLCSKGYIYSQTYSILSKFLTLFQGLQYSQTYSIHSKVLTLFQWLQI